MFSQTVINAVDHSWMVSLIFNSYSPGETVVVHDSVIGQTNIRRALPVASRRTILAQHPVI